MNERLIALVVLLPLLASITLFIHAMDKRDGAFAIASALFFIGFAFMVRVSYGKHD